MTEKEEILNKVATRLMNQWSIDDFKITHKRLFDVIMDSMDSYHHQQVKKLNIDYVSNSCFDRRPDHITEEGEWIGGDKEFYNK